MTNDVNARIALSAQTFRHDVWPVIVSLFGPGTLIPIETNGDDVSKLIDMHAHIDYIFQKRGGSPMGISSRVSRSATTAPARMFTMKRREHDYLRDALERPIGQLMPSVHIQAYVTRREAAVDVDSVGIVRVPSLLRQGERVRSLREGPYGPYYAWPFDDLGACGVQVVEIPDPRLVDPFLAA